MPDQESISATQKLLRAHRQTLSVLLEQKAKLGLYAPSGVLIGIAETRQAIEQCKVSLRAWSISVEDLPIDRVEQLDQASAQDLTPTSATGLPPGSAHSSGDLIIGTVGTGAQGVAIGKHIYQELEAQSTAEDDRYFIKLLIQRCESDLASAAGLDTMLVSVATLQLGLLGGELSKVKEHEKPSANTIVQVSDWLLTNLPVLRNALTALFSDPSVGRVLRRSDRNLDGWLHYRFGV